MIARIDNFFKCHKDFGAIFIRLLVGFHLIYGVIDNVVSWERMLEFEAFLQYNNFPLPIISAVVSVYAQLICGVFFILGLYVRQSALIMIINFLVALTVHLDDSYPGAFPALAMLSAAFFLLFNGAGLLSIDQTRDR